MRIEPAKASDAAEIARLLAAAGLPTADLTPRLLESFLVLRDGATVVATVGLECKGGSALLRSLAVADARRGSGTGRAMLAAAESLARRRGFGDLYLLTTDSADFFAKQGYWRAQRAWAPEGIRATQQFAGLCPASSSFMVKTLEPKTFNVLFLCTGNSARSILAEAIMNKFGRGSFHAYSAGSHPKGAPNPYALALLRELDIPVEGLRSKSWDEFAKPDSPPMDFVFTVCDKAAGEQCPYWPGQPMTAHWGLADPAEVEGSDAVRHKAFLDAFMILKRRIDLFTSLPFSSLEHMALSKRIREIGTS
jgi:protein-tyrosine-phosphatase/N-acetylglutamate synthase-like GNAT family acetyltransferase